MQMATDVRAHRRCCSQSAKARLVVISDQQRGVFVELADQLEQQLAARLAERQIEPLAHRARDAGRRIGPRRQRAGGRHRHTHRRTQFRGVRPVASRPHRDRNRRQHRIPGPIRRRRRPDFGHPGSLAPRAARPRAQRGHGVPVERASRSRSSFMGRGRFADGQFPGLAIAHLLCYLASKHPRP